MSTESETVKAAAKPKRINFTQACVMAMDEAMAADPRVILLGEDIADDQGGGVFGATKGLSSKYGTDRVRSTPISEQAIIGAAIGAALVGYRPVAEIMLMNFITVDGPGRQSCRQTAFHVGRPDKGSDHDPHGDRSRGGLRRAA